MTQSSSDQQSSSLSYDTEEHRKRWLRVEEEQQEEREQAWHRLTPRVQHLVTSHNDFLMRRPRADTMPTTTTTANIKTIPPPLGGSLANGIFHTNNWSSAESPTTPTTDQLLKDDRIASTLASLGLEDYSDDVDDIYTRRHHTLHQSRSFNSLRSEWYLGRPRAISVTDRTPLNIPPMGGNYLGAAAWSSSRTGSPLRSSNSSADLLEMMARQRRLDENKYDLDGCSSSSGGKSSPLLQTPTRSLWLGNIDPALTITDLSCVFGQYGTIESIRILQDRECAFINFATIEDALRAKDALMHNHHQRLGNTLVKVGFGKPEAHCAAGGGPPVAADLGTNVQGPTRALWIGNIPSFTTCATLMSLFSPFGPIESVRVLTHKNCGFVNFESQEDAVRAKRALQNKELMGAGTGPVRIGFAKVPPASNNNKSNNSSTTALATSFVDFDDPEEYQAQLMMYMMANNSANLFAAMAAERRMLMKEFGEEDNDGPTFDELHTRMSYYSVIPPAPELGQTRKIDIARLRDVRKRLDTGYVSTEELETLAIECLDEIVELCSDYIGNTVIQRLFERCSEATKSQMMHVVAPYLASIGIHKNGTWAAQKIIDTAKLPSQIDLVCDSIKPYVPALLLDQFGNYVVQCCLGLGPERNQFIFDAIAENCWEIAQGRFGARAVRATLESPHVTKRQQKYIAATIIQHSLLLAMNANGALLLIWLLDTSGISGRYRVLAPRLTPHLARLCTHKLASLTVLKIVNQRQEPDARSLILDTLFFSTTTEVLEEILKDQVHGVNLIQKILSSSYVELRERQRIAERVKQLLNRLKLNHVQGYKRLVEEINMVMGDSNPGASLGALPGLLPPITMNPELAAALHAKYLALAAAAIGASSTTSSQQQQQQQQQQQHEPPAVEEQQKDESKTQE